MRVEVDKSGRATCKKCGKMIPKGSLRLVDDSEWQELKAEGGGEGLSRGYIEMGNKTISRQGKKFHLACATSKGQRANAKAGQLGPAHRDEWEKWRAGEKLEKPASAKPKRRLTALEKANAMGRERRRQKRLAAASNPAADADAAN